ncbi:PAS domain S-box protein [Spirulina sp. 06S082]|uniref:PAS domain S-box protein n=1 Tax=Spirulina sp. 06S082 TaxID=3110248 RepID=UPI002B216C04|nr:PAS domain S-box protein [Spirulina sp. 06S082]MEA5467624.1 PAS domain S-box protein [Spirulina sp. 06S082]
MPKKLKLQEKEIAELKEENQRLQQQLAESQHRCSQKEQELQKTQAELEAIRRGYSSDSEGFLRLAIDNIPGAIFWKDSQSVYLGCNQYFANLTGLNSPVDIVGKTDYDLPWKPEETEFFRECDRRVMDSDTPELGIIEPAQQADGNSYWLETNKIPLHDSQGNVIGILGTFADISDRIKTEKALQKLNNELEEKIIERTQKLHDTEIRLQRLIDNIPGLIFQFRLEADGTPSFPYVSEGSRDIYELDPSNFSQSFDLVHQNDIDSLHQTIQESARSLIRFDHEHRIITPSGILKWVQIISKPERQEDNAIIWDGIIIDITDRKHAEEELLIFKRAVESASDAIAIANPQGELIYQNLAHIQLYHCETIENYREMGGIAACYPDSDIYQEVVLTVLNGESWMGEAEQRSRNGRHFPAIISANGIKDELGELLGLIGIITDISDRKAIAQALQESEAKYQQILDSITDMVLVKREKSQIVWGNKSFRDYYGMSNEELQSLIDASFNNPDYTQQYVRDDAYVFETGQLLEVEEPVTRHDGEVRQFNTIKSAIRNEKGEIILTVGVSRDITDRKKAEQELQKQKQLLRSIYDGVSNPIFVVDVLENKDFRFISFNRATEQITGMTNEECFHKTPEEIFAPDQARNIRQNYNHCLDIGTSFAYEESVNFHGENYWYLTIINPIKNAAGTIIRLVGTSLNITGRKRQEEALQESTELISQQAQREKLLNQLTNQIRNSLDLKQIINTTVQEIQRFIEVDRCHFAWYVEEGEKAYWDIVAEVQTENLPSFIGRHSVSAFGPLSEMVLRRQTVHLNDVSQIEDREVREFVMTLGNQSMLVLPVWDNTGERYGIIACIQHQEVRPWHDDEVELLEAVADQLAIALNQANLLTQSQARTQELENLLERLQRTQTQLIQSEKMSSLGQMVAGVAHEINNPVNFIHGNLVHANEYTEDLLGLLDLYQKYYPQPHPDICKEIEAIDLDFLKADLQKLLRSMRVGTDRISGIVRSLRTFSRLDESEVKDVNLHDGIDSTLMILQTRLRSQDWRPEIKIIKNYGELPLVECYAGQLNQVFMNIISNAIDALEERDRQRTLEQMQAHPSQIDIQTQRKDNNIIIRICDNGMGMSETTRSKLFDPFFTTKSIGKGTGLGLSISYQIVTEKHNGQLSCASKPGETVFLIEIPI